MRKPRPGDFDPNFKNGKSPKPEKVDLSGVVAIKPRPKALTKSLSTPSSASAKPADESKQSSNIAILQLSEGDIDDLREAAYKAQTFRFTETEIEWLKDTSHQLSKEVKRGKVAQADILRTALKLFSNVLSSHKRELLSIIERMK